MKKFQIRKFWCVLGWLVLSPIWAAGIQANLDASQIELGQQVRLTLTYDPHEAHSIPNLTALRADFAILATEQSMSYTVLNGQAQSVGQWSIVLEPKHEGSIIIPAISLGNLQSEPLQLNVSPPTTTAVQSPQAAPQSDSEKPQLLVKVEPMQPYLHQEVVYKVQLLNRDRLYNVRYQPPQVENAVLMTLGEQEYQTTINGVPYHVDEQRYAIFPQKSGALKIKPPILQATLFQTFPEDLRLVAQPKTLAVQPLPSGQSLATWLPSKMVRLQETYDSAEIKFSPGATLTRTIRLQAQGLVSQLLPNLPAQTGKGWHAYADKSILDNEIRQDVLWGNATVKLTYVFTRPGHFTIPAVKVPWFDVKTQQVKIAELPAKSLQIVSKKKVSPQPTQPNIQKSVPAMAKPSGEKSIWGWSALILVILGLLGYFINRKRPVQSRGALRRACLRNDSVAAKEGLMAWASREWPEKKIRHISDILMCTDDAALSKELNRLIKILYHEPQTSWQGQYLWQAIQGYKKKKSKKRQAKQSLPPINPSH